MYNFEKINTIDVLKRTYKLSLERNTQDAWPEIQDEYRQAMERISREAVEDKDRFKAKKELEDGFDDILQTVTRIPVTVELCGLWIWITGGQTREHKELLKKSGFRWAPKKKAWYWRPAGLRKFRGHKPWEMKDIKQAYSNGSADLEEKEVNNELRQGGRKALKETVETWTSLTH